MIRIVLKRTSKTVQTISVDEKATPGSWGSHQLLLEKYKRLDEEWIDGGTGTISGKFKQLHFNTSFLEGMLQKHGELHCEFCGKQHLRIYHWREHKRGPDMATTDHFLPRKDFPELAFSKENLLVACSKCNQNKAKKILSHEVIRFPYPDHKLEVYMNFIDTVKHFSKQLINV